MKRNKKIVFIKINNQGMSLITVIITIGFVAVLASILLMVSLINFKMKKINAYGTDTFYSAEQVLDEINIGLQREVSNALTAAYTEVMENYADYDTEKKNTIMQTKYYEYLWAVLEQDSGHKKYDTNQLYQYLKKSTQWRGTDEDGYGAILRVEDTPVADDSTLPTIGSMVTYDDNGIVLKNLKVYYKDKRGYVSAIRTDIRLDYPDFDFAASTALPDISDFSLIADAGVKTTGTTKSNLTINGDLYADSFNSGNLTGTVGRTITLKDENRFIVKHGLNLKNASFTDDPKSELWAETIQASGSEVLLTGESNLINDLDLKGKKTSVTLKGNYNGYGNSLTDANKSSAFLINGVDASIDMTKIKSLVLAGHAYVGSKENNYGDTTSTEANKGNDVLTGESIAVKSNQLLYLIPAECIGVAKTAGYQSVQQNPVLADSSVSNDDYEKVTDTANYTEVDLSVNVAQLGSSLSPYMSIKGTQPDPEKVFVRTSDPNQVLVYYYMKFKDENAANRYFNLYYNAKKVTADQYLNAYVKSIRFPETAKPMQLRIAGNTITGENDSTSTTGISTYSTIPAYIEDASVVLKTNYEKKGKTFTALCTKLIKNYTQLTDLNEKPDETKQIVYENLIDAASLTEFASKGSGGTVVLSGTDSTGKTVKALVTTGDCNGIPANVHLVIAKGNVTIGSDFEGTVLCDGELTIKGDNIKLSTAPETVKTLLALSQTYDDGTVHPVASVLKGGTEFIYASLTPGEEKEDGTKLSDIVRYENWTKE